MWVAVITQAMMDALSRSKQAEARYYKQEAIHWLSDNSRDFVEVCLLAGLSPDYVRTKAKRAMVKPTSWRAAPGKGRRYLERKAYRKSLKKSPASESASPPVRAQVLIGPWV